MKDTWLIELQFSVDYSREEVLIYLDSVLDFDDIDGYEVIG